MFSHNTTRKSVRVSNNRKDRQTDIKIDRRRGTTVRHTDVDDNDPAAKKVDGLWIKTTIKPLTYYDSDDGDVNESPGGCLTVKLSS